MDRENVREANSSVKGWFSFCLLSLKFLTDFFSYR